MGCKFSTFTCQKKHRLQFPKYLRIKPSMSNFGSEHHFLTDVVPWYLGTPTKIGYQGVSGCHWCVWWRCWRDPLGLVCLSPWGYSLCYQSYHQSLVHYFHCNVLWFLCKNRKHKKADNLVLLLSFVSSILESWFEQIKFPDETQVGHA